MGLKSSKSPPQLAKETRIDLGQSETDDKSITFAIVSDTHNYAHLIAIPDADIFIHAGDFTKKGKRTEVIKFNDWLGKLPHKHKVVVAGNHDRKPSILKKLLTNCTFLEEIEGLYIHGSKWEGDWELIPEKTDILITHIPPGNLQIGDNLISKVGHLDIVHTGESRGSATLATKVKQIQPKFHIFGHNHQGYGVETEGKVVFIGAATCEGPAKSKIRRGAFFFEYCPNVDVNFDSIHFVK